MTLGPTRRSAFSNALIHLAVESSHFETRKSANAFVQALNLRVPKLAHTLLREGVSNWLLTVRLRQKVSPGRPSC